MADKAANLGFPHTHLLGIEGLSRTEISSLLDKSEEYVEQNRKADKKVDLLRGRTIINLFFENSTRTRTSFELAGKRLSADVINMSLGYPAKIHNYSNKLYQELEKETGQSTGWHGCGSIRLALNQEDINWFYLIIIL